MGKEICDECLTSQEREILVAKIDKVREEILGKDWYIVDPVGGCQACEIILDEVIKRYKRLEERTAPWYIRLCRYFKSGFGGE